MRRKTTKSQKPINQAKLAGDCCLLVVRAIVAKKSQGHKFYPISFVALWRHCLARLQVPSSFRVPWGLGDTDNEPLAAMAGSIEPALVTPFRLLLVALGYLCWRVLAAVIGSFASFTSAARATLW
jgi:hypothetical protein